MQKKRKTVLLTGGTGSVGMNICERLLEEAIDVVLFARRPLDKRDAAALTGKPGTLRQVQGDVLCPDSLRDAIQEYRVTDVIHGAAVTPGVEDECRQTARIFQINCVGVANALDAARECSGRFILLGSISAYGRTALADAPLVEGESVADPRSMYELSKFTAERLALRYGEACHCPVHIARIGDVYGPWEHCSGVRPHMSFPYQLTYLARRGETARLPRASRMDWIYGPDLARAIHALLTAPSPRYSVYPMSSGFRWSITEWCALLQKRYPAFTYELVDDPARATIRINQPRDNAAMSTQRMIEDLGCTPSYDLHRSFAHYMAWLDSHPEYMDREIPSE